jgi:murein DD-endopeptidase MepM/ murein hydrolase activator NlpD
MYRRGNHARHISCGWLGYAGHEAIDITTGSPNVIEGYPIYAQGIGSVTGRSGAAQHPTMGFWIQITYTINGTAHRTRYLHMENTPPSWLTDNPSTQVSASTQLGTTGDTGSPGAFHLHLDVTLPNGNRTNPRNMFPDETFTH